MLCACDIYTGRGVSDVVSSVIIKLWYGIFLVVIVALLESNLKCQIRAEAVAKLWNSKDNAAVVMLHVFYDAVVELDQELVVKDSGQDSVFLLGSLGGSADGKEFQSLLAEAEDVQRFNDYVRESRSTEQPTADVLHASMRRIDGNHFNVELFIIKFEGLNFCTQYLLGIRESSVEEPSELFINRAVLHAPADASLIVAATRGYPVLASSPKCQRIIRHEAGCNLNSLLYVTPELDGYVQQAINDFALHGQGEMNETLRVRFRVARDQVVHANCWAVKPAGYESYKYPVACLVFDDFVTVHPNNQRRGQKLANLHRPPSTSIRQSMGAGTPIQLEGRHVASMVTL
mmetsp:Transcript_11921/g.22831  ORF Transcript_11921/g.22831 Transcript_11921/m.22831 type:complete len:345 (+) Transcript_11921:1-1035(+)